MTVSGGTVGPTLITCDTNAGIEGKNNNVVWANEHPLSHQAGTMDVDIAGCFTPATRVFETGFAVGLWNGDDESYLLQ